jgi:hypothetical protein
VVVRYYIRSVTITGRVDATLNLELSKVKPLLLHTYRTLIRSWSAYLTRVHLLLLKPYVVGCVLLYALTCPTAAPHVVIWSDLHGFPISSPRICPTGFLRPWLNCINSFLVSVLQLTSSVLHLLTKHCRGIIPNASLIRKSSSRSLRDTDIRFAILALILPWIMEVVDFEQPRHAAKPVRHLNAPAYALR